MAKNAQCVADLGKDLYDRFVTCLGHVVALEKNLKRSVESFNGMVGSIESRVLPGLRRFPELGVTDKDQVPSLNPVQDTPRQILSDEARQEAFEA
jgi:DNA recombination protein RmuC